MIALKLGLPPNFSAWLLRTTVFSAELLLKTARHCYLIFKRIRVSYELRL